MTCDYIALARSGIQSLKPYQPGKPVEELQRELGLDEIVKLASNENPLGPPESVLEAVQRAASDLCRYPDGNGFQLKQAIVEKLGIEPVQLTLGNGSNDVLELLARAYLNPGDEVVFSEHAFAVYHLVTMACDGVPAVAPAKDYGHDLDAIYANINSKTRIVFLANPNNPTGTWFGKPAFEAFMDRVPENVLVVLDEAYSEYVDEPEYPDGLEYLGKFSNLVVTRTFSKAYGLAGLRVGYAVSSTAVADVLNRVRQPFNVNSVALAAATAAIGDDAFLAQSVELNNKGMKQLESGLSALGYSYIPSAGNFISFMIPEAGTVYQSLLEKGVIVRPVDMYGLRDCLRVSIGTPAENRFFLDKLAMVGGNVA